MAAVKRSSGSGLLVGMIVCLVLFLIGLGCAVWFYQQGAKFEKALAVNQDAFAQKVGKQFSQNAWDLKAASPPELGVVRYEQEAFTAVAGKLQQAAEYEKVVRPLLGWESLEGIQTAMAASPVQKEAEAAGEAKYASLRVLLKRYEDSYQTLTEEVASLAGSNQDLSDSLESTRQDLVETQQRLNQELNDVTSRFNDALTALRADHSDMTDRHGRQRREAVAWRQRHQEEVDERRSEVATLQDQVARWRTMYEDEVAGPGPREQLTADGTVIQVWADYDFVMVEGGLDREVEEGDAFVVYSVQPDGSTQRKALLRVGRVNEHTSLATIAREDAYIIDGDYFVSLDRWEQFHREATTAEAGP